MKDRVESIIKHCENETETAFEKETSDGLKKFFTYLLDYNQKVNLISRKSEVEVLKTALVESYSLFELIRESEGKFLDVGSGGGLPGMIIAIMMPYAEITLLDSTRKKTVFLESAVKAARIKNVKVINGRLEELSVSKKYDLIFSRGVGNFEILKNHYLKRIADTGTVFILTGEDNKPLFKEFQTFENPFLPGRLIAVLEK
jgi:16S rRNA (guanine527-N7)-methyltransferase